MYLNPENENIEFHSFLFSLSLFSLLSLDKSSFTMTTEASPDEKLESLTLDNGGEAAAAKEEAPAGEVRLVQPSRL